MGTQLSEVKLPSKDTRSWLEKETQQTFVPVHAKARKLLDEMRKKLDSLSEASKMLLDNSAKEIEKRNMKTYGRARALNKLARLFVDRMRTIKPPEQVSYKTLEDFVQDTQKAFAVTDVDVANWFPRISPFFILDRRKFSAIFEKAKDSLRILEYFLSKEYVKTRTLEETFRLVDEVLASEQELAKLENQKTRIEAEQTSVGGEIAKIQMKISDLRSKGNMGKLDQTSTEIETLSVEVKHSLQHLQKPFVKLQSLATHGGGSGLTPEELNKLDQYIQSPFEALATETSGTPLLKEMLKKLGRSISEGKLKLKPEKIRKAEQAIDNITNKDTLVALHQKSQEATMRKTQLSTSTEIEATRQDLFKLHEHLEHLGRKKGIAESEREALQRKRDETVKTINTGKSQIEKNIMEFLSRKVHVE
jgi:predicted  nucleic acid-binding Zn-ribbon protein